MAKRVNRDTRLGQSGNSLRKDRDMEDRDITQDRELSDDERLAEVRQAFFQSVLPDIPPIPGWHVCWLTTANPRDPIHSRIRMGYEPIKASDIPGWDHASLKSGEWEGCIGVNEMIAFKLPLKLYEAYMTEVHHTQPNFEEDKLTVATEAAEAEASGVAKQSISFQPEEGQAELGSDQVLTPPSFTETLGGR